MVHAKLTSTQICLHARTRRNCTPLPVPGVSATAARVAGKACAAKKGEGARKKRGGVTSFYSRCGNQARKGGRARVAAPRLGWERHKWGTRRSPVGSVAAGGRSPLAASLARLASRALSLSLSSSPPFSLSSSLSLSSIPHTCHSFIVSLSLSLFHFPALPFLHPPPPSPTLNNRHPRA